LVQRFTLGGVKYLINIESRVANVTVGKVKEVLLDTGGRHGNIQSS